MEDITRFASLGNYSQSMETKEVCILVASDDDICSNIVASMLKYCTYEAFKYNSEMDAFDAMWGRKGGVEVVLTNIYRTEPVGTRLSTIEHIEKDFNLTTFLMLPDGGVKKIKSKGLAGGSTVYYVKNMSHKVIKNLYINSLMEIKGKIEGNELVDSAQRSLLSQYVAGTNNVNTSSSSDEENWGTNMQKRKEQDRQTRHDSSVEKKPRIVWNDDMQKKFLDAIEKIGYEKAVPKKIVEAMNVPGLTREKVASHLQKHRIIRKPAEEKLSSLLLKGRKLTNNVKAPPSHVGVSQQPHQLGSSRNNISTLNSSSGHSSHEAAAASASNSRSRPGRGYIHFDYGCVMDFGRMKKTDQLVRENQSCRFYDDRTTNILSSIANRWSGNNATSSSTSNSPCIGPRLINGGQSMEFGNFRRAGITREMGFSAGGNFIPIQEQHFGHGKNSSVMNFIPPLQESPPPVSQLQISNIEKSLLISQQEQYIGNHDSSRLGNCNSLQESVLPLPQLQVSNIATSLPPLYNNGNGPISNFIPQQEQYFGENGNDDSDWTLDLEAIDRLLEQEKSLPPLSGEMAWNEAAAASVPPMMALPSESNSLRIYGGNCITENGAAAPPLVGFEQNSFGVDDGGLEALLQETESTNPQLFWEDIFDGIFCTS